MASSSSKRPRVEYSSSSSDSSNSTDEDSQPLSEFEIQQRQEDDLMVKYFINQECEEVITELAKLKPQQNPEYFNFLSGVSSYFQGKTDGLFILADITAKGLLPTYTYTLRPRIVKTEVLPHLQRLNVSNRFSTSVNEAQERM